MRALVVDPDAPGRIAIQELPEPSPRSDEAIVAVRAASLNRGEVLNVAVRPAGWVPGWDVAGVVETAAADGSGPSAGTRVVGMLPLDGGGWAERTAVPTHTLAPIPDALSFEAASTLPVAGLTAWRALALGGLILERRVAITGAAGGVGRFAVQLAHRAGAHVTAIVGSPERAAGLRELGADAIEVGVAATGASFDVVLDGVGGEQLVAALGRIDRDGIFVNYGTASGTSATIDVRTFQTTKWSARIYAFMVFEEVRRTATGVRELMRLAELVAAGELDPQIELTTSWRDAPAAFERLLDRRVAGKAVLTLD